VPALPAPRASSRTVVFLLQAALWVALTLAFAALIELAGMAAWTEALVFSSTNWLPWIVLAPAAFWLARRFPFERGQLLRSIPVHTVACAGCCLIMLWVGAYFAPWRGFRPPSGDGRANSWDRRESAGMSEIAGPLRDPRERAMQFRRNTGAAPLPADPALAGPLPPTEKAAASDPAAAGSRPERSPDRRPKMPYRGPPVGPGPSNTAVRTFTSRFWPPFSGIVLRANVSAAVYVIVACFAHAFAYYRRAQDQEKEAMTLAAGLSRAKLDALRLQLQPHFLFNTLNAISTLVHRDPRAADELIGDLSELLRLSLQTADHEVPLSRELELLECYLAIEQTRLGSRLRIVREIDPQALAALVPTFVLQPLAENAVRHGIEPRLAPGTITIRADLVGGNVRLVVSDDGVGLKNSPGGGTRRGIGIANTEERLRALHGAAAHLDLLAPETGGVQVQIVLPFRTTSAATEERPA
jgi:hypothetical protein